MSEAPFRILGIQQIAIGGLKKEKNLLLWQELFGLDVIDSFSNKSHNVNETRLSIGTGDYPAEIDIMEPIDPEAHPAIHTHPLHHVGLWVDRLDVAIEYLKEKGVRFVSDVPVIGAAGYEVVFIHPSASKEFPLCGEGVLIELVQYPGNASL